MVERLPGILEHYRFSDDNEMYSAVIFTDMQVLHLSSELAAAMEEKLGIAGDNILYKEPEIFIRAHEYTRGKIDVLNWLLHVHEEAKKRQMTNLEFERTKEQMRAEFEASTRPTSESSSI